jgi:tripartite ATP-independent transporter DctP family solute receptor
VHPYYTTPAGDDFRRKEVEMKKSVFLSLPLAAVLGLTACGGGSGGSSSHSGGNSSGHSGKTMSLKMSDDQPKNYPTVKGDKDFAKRVKNKTNGRIKIRVYPSGSLGSETDVVQQVQQGSIDFQRLNGSPLADYDKDMGVLSMPYLFKSDKQKWKVLNGAVGKHLLNTLKSHKLVGLTYYDSGDRNFYNSKHPVKKPSDMKGLKIRVQKSSITEKMIKALGASPTPMDYDEVYSALKSGVIDGAENNFPSYYTTNHYKAAKYFTEDEHVGVPEVVLASKETWNKFSDKDKKIIRSAARHSQKVERKSWDALVKKSKKKVKAGGAKITKVPNKNAWRKAEQPVYDKYGPRYKKYIDKINKVGK